MKRGLVIQTAFLGDVILALPLAQALKKMFPESQVDFLAIPETAEIPAGHPDISQVIVFDKHEKHRSLSEFLNFRAGLSRRLYDVVLCPHRSLRSAMLVQGTRARVRVGFDRSSWKRGFTHLMPWKFGMHEIERNLSLISPLGAAPEREEPRLYPMDERKREAEDFLSAHGVSAPYAVVAPGTVWFTKRYPAPQMAEVVRGLLARFSKVVLVGGMRDAKLAEEFAALGSSVVSAVGKLPFMSSAEIIRRASLLVANDSAPIHVASAFNVPTAAIFGPTVRDFGFYPYHRRSAVIEMVDLGCRPCSIHGGKRCPIGTFDCMRNIPAERVLSESDKLLGGHNG